MKKVASVKLAETVIFYRLWDVDQRFPWAKP